MLSDVAYWTEYMFKKRNGVLFQNVVICTLHNLSFVVCNVRFICDHEMLLVSLQVSGLYSFVLN